MNQLTRMLFILALVAGPASAGADCMKNRESQVICGRGQCGRTQEGKVFCSRYEDGTVVRTRYGRVLCGKGKCVTTSDGEVFCSTVEGGSALKDLNGNVRCEGECEPGSMHLCESNPAGSP